jgi:hypothetical protein
MVVTRVLHARPVIQDRSARASASPQTAIPVTAPTMYMTDDLAVTVTVATRQIPSMQSKSGIDTVMELI